MCPPPFWFQVMCSEFHYWSDCRQLLVGSQRAQTACEDRSLGRLWLRQRWRDVFKAVWRRHSVWTLAFSGTRMQLDPLLGKMSDTYGRRPVALFGTMVTMVFGSLFGVSSSYFQMVVFFGAGAFQANIATARTIIGEVCTPKQTALGLATVSTRSARSTNWNANPTVC